jgi:16S rRNA (uracil1498-N3)-methyltransferase
MRLHRFIGDFTLAPGRITTRDAGLANQLANVLRMRAGDAVVLCDGNGQDALATIVAIGRAEVEFDIQEIHPSVAEPTARVTLYLAVIKRENFELAVQKAVEAGVTAIVPVITSRTVKHGLRLDRLTKIAREAAEQSGRGTVPAISEPQKLDAAFAAANQQALRAFFDLGGAPAMAALVSAKAQEVELFIGPEGGWESAERESAEARGFHIMGLGARTLRAETAAIVATYLATSAS